MKRVIYFLATVMLLAVTYSVRAQACQVSTTFTNPTPAFGDFFGRSVAAVGADKVLIGAQYNETGSANPGAAYMLVSLSKKVRGLPRDLAAQHNHYLYGTPKR